MVFKEHKPNTWVYSNDGDFVEGKLVKIEPNHAYEDKKIYTLEKADKSQILVFGTTVLDSKMVGINLGDLIRIIYKGSKANAGKNATKLFEVLKDDGN